MAARASVKREDSSPEDEYASSSDSESLSPWSREVQAESERKLAEEQTMMEQTVQTLRGAAEALTPKEEAEEEQQPEPEVKTEEEPAEDTSKLIRGKDKKKKKHRKHEGETGDAPLPPVREVSFEQEGEEDSGKHDARLAVNRYLSVKKKGGKTAKKVWPKCDWFKQIDGIKRHEPRYYAVCEQHWQAEADAKQVAFDEGLALEEFWPRWNRVCQSPGQPQLTGRFESSPELCAAFGHWHDCGKKKEKLEETLVLKHGPTGSNQIKRTLDTHFEEISPNPWVQVIDEEDQGMDDDEEEEEEEEKDEEQQGEDHMEREAEVEAGEQGARVRVYVPRI